MLLRRQLIINGILTGVLLLGSSITHSEVIFSDSFDEQPDWNSGLPENHYGSNTTGGASTGGWEVDVVQSADTHTIPLGWSYVRQTPAYAPSRGDVNNHEVIEISSASTFENPNRVRGGTGKSFVSWRDSNTKQFVSDGILLKYFPEGFDQLYVEFWVNFSDEMIATYYNPDYQTQTTGLAKLFRVYHWTGQGNVFDYYSDKNPAFLWGFEGRPESQRGYGFRNKMSALTRRTISTDPAQSKFLDHQGNPSNQVPSSYHPVTTTRYGDSILKDQRDGKLMSLDQFSADIDEVFGDETHWTKMAFFVKMNSAPGAYDGQLVQWIDGKKITDIKTMQWVSATRNMVKWTTIGFGGNDNFDKYPNELRHEEWYAVDDIKVATKIPDELIGDSKNTAPPQPPLGITIE